MRISAGRPKPVGIWRPIYQAMDTSKAFHITTKPQANSDCAASLAIGLAATAPGLVDMELGPVGTALGLAVTAPGPADTGLGRAVMAPGQVDTGLGRVVMAPGPAVTALGRAAMAPGPDPMAIRPSPNGSPTGRTNLAPGLAA